MENYIVYLEQKGLAGMEDIFDSGWGYCLPNGPYRLYEVLKRTQGNHNSESWNGYKRIKMQSRLDDPAITASINFLVLLGFITYKSGVKTQTSNRYTVTDFINILALQETSTLQYLLKVVKRVRQASSSPKQTSKFTTPIKTMEKIIAKFTNGEIELIPSELRQKELSNGTTKVVRGIGGDVDYFERYENTLKAIMNFLEALYSVLRNGNNFPLAQCNGECRIGKCKCIEEITNEDSLMNFLQNNKSCESQEHTSESQEGTGESQDSTCEGQEDNKNYNINYNKNQNIDDERNGIGSSKMDSSEVQGSSKSFSQTGKSELISKLRTELEFYFKGEELHSLDKLLKVQTNNLSVSQIDEVLKIIVLFKTEGYPIDTPTKYFPAVFENPDLSQARGAVRRWKMDVEKAAREERKLAIEEAKQEKRNASKPQNHDESAKRLGLKTVLEEIQEKLNLFDLSLEEKNTLFGMLEERSGSHHNHAVLTVLKDLIDNCDITGFNVGVLKRHFSNPYPLYDILNEKLEEDDINPDDLPF